MVLAETGAVQRKVRLVPARVTVNLLLAAELFTGLATGRSSTGCAPGWRACGGHDRPDGRGRGVSTTLGSWLWHVFDDLVAVPGGDW
jgi:hypothetical protein